MKAAGLTVSWNLFRRCSLMSAPPTTSARFWGSFCQWMAMPPRPLTPITPMRNCAMQSSPEGDVPPL
jgi:hypothetical protein